MEQLYGDFDASYNELQGWIAATREYDGNNNVLPIAFAIVDKENIESWEFFLTNLRRRSGVPWRSVYCIRHIASNFHRDYKNPDWKRQVVKMAYELEPHIFRQRMTRLENDMEGQTNTSFRQWLGTMEPWQWAQSFDEGFRYGQMTTNLVEGINTVLLKTRHLPISSVFSATFYRDAMVANRWIARLMNIEVYSQRNETFRVTETIGRRPGIPPKSYGVDLRNRRCDCRRFQTLHYPCAHVVAACAKVSLNVDQFIDEVYTLERTLRVWENEFPVLPDLSTWEVPPTTFELVPDKGLRRNPKGRPQSSRIRNEMDIREKSDGKLCGVCRLQGHNRNKCPLQTTILDNRHDQIEIKILLIACWKKKSHRVVLNGFFKHFKIDCF
ncbi:uncharacterized protein [Gossypium hirsutum]|uniref:SWIM-type domain-containing protein n=1 Tax=Gossypium hirsutum TaxID=3635 RepID=A0ABM2ZBW4_GOSHI|nr:uncharacterized protein LOC121211451 [Gossypium hirsutum]